MGSSFKGEDLFGSGVHRVLELRRGRRVVSLSTIAGSASVPGTAEYGDYEIRVEVRGRLVASNEEGLWALRDAIVAESHSDSVSGVLIDEHGHEWTGVKLLNYQPAGHVEHGRVVSQGYVVEFGQLASG